MAVLVGATAASVVLASLQTMRRHGHGVTTIGPSLVRTGSTWGRSAMRRVYPADQSDELPHAA
jgi:hypothetical protein